MPLSSDKWLLTGPVAAAATTSVAAATTAAAAGLCYMVATTSVTDSRTQLHSASVVMGCGGRASEGGRSAWVEGCESSPLAPARSAGMYQTVKRRERRDAEERW